MTENLFAEPNLKQITVWARGVLQNKDARCCRCTDRGSCKGGRTCPGMGKLCGPA